MPSNAANHLLSILRDRGPHPRAELARLIGVSSPALTKIAAQLLAEGLVVERTAAERQQLGRPPIDIALVPEAAFVIGVHLGAGFLEIALTNAMLEPIETGSLDFDSEATAKDLLIQVSRDINRIIDRNDIPRARLTGIGVAVPGRVDADGLSGYRSANPQWENIALAPELEQATGLPVTLEHNATSIALAETRYGTGRNSNGTLYVYLGKGIGAGIAHASHLEQVNRARGPVELGHIALDPDGAICHCGARGCLETVFSEEVLRGLFPNSGKADLVGNAMCSPEWPAHYHRLLQSLAAAITLMTPDLLVFGGHFSKAPQEFYDDLNRDLPGRIPAFLRDDLRIERSSFSQSPGAIGAAAVGLERFFYTGSAKARR